MNFFELILKQIRQRSLSTILTVFSIALGVGLAIAIIVLHREGQHVFGQTDYGYQIIVGPKASSLQLVVNTVYHIDKSPGNVKWEVLETLRKDPNFRADVKQAIPQCVGDSYNGQPIVGTVPQFFGYDDAGKRIENTEDDPNRRFTYRPGQSFEIAAGRIFNNDKFEAVIGSDVSAKTGLKLGDTFQATHGFPQPGAQPDVHKEKWTVVGVLKPTHTAADKCVWIGLTSFYTIFEHAEAEIQRNQLRTGEKMGASGGEDEGKKHYTVSPDGIITLDPDVMAGREISAILVKTRGSFNAMRMLTTVNILPDVMAVSPAVVMRDFFSNFLEGPVTLLLVISCLVTVVAAVGILTTIYNSVAARSREIAILRALGATKTRILFLISVEAAFVGAVGGAIGFVLGHAMCAVGSGYLARTLGEPINWVKVGPEELLYLVAVVVIAFIAGLVPALKAYKTPVAVNLVAL